MVYLWGVAGPRSCLGRWVASVKMPTLRAGRGVGRGRAGEIVTAMDRPQTHSLAGSVGHILGRSSDSFGRRLNAVTTCSCQLGALLPADGDVDDAR
jgi:hypothetical protein